MSGIVGVFSSIREEIILELIQKISHRGTSKPKIWSGAAGSLGSICYEEIPETPGPITTPSGERAIVMDGRLTSILFLHELLEFHTITSDADAEMVLHAYEEIGARLFGHLEGEFALAIMDGDRLIMARDRLGISPLYYGFSDGTIYFASEIKCLLGFAEQIHEFPPGHFLISNRGLFPYQPYLPEAVQLDGALESAEKLAEYLNRAVERAMPGDVEVGVWLSGGVDSSVIAALARPYTKKLHTFSAGIEGAPDLEYARQVALHIGAEHHEHIYVLADMLEVINKVIYHLESFDAPLVHSAVSNYLVSKLASDYVPFVLSGEGGDELFAGYVYQKTYTSELELILSIQQSIASLHNTALQRVDRSAAAHGTGVAVPFLDPEVVRYALAIPARWKIRGPQAMEKWPLRKGLADTLPMEVIWRAKSKFWEGSGTGDMLTDHANQNISDDEFEAGRILGNGDQLKSKEELSYYRIFREYFGDSVPYQEIGRTQHV